MGNTEIEFKRGVPKNFAFRDEVMATLCLALKSIGNGHLTDEQRMVLKRFSEDIDLAIDLKYFGLEGDMTKKQLKRMSVVSI